jgi:hypothetical protein
MFSQSVSVNYTIPWKKGSEKPGDVEDPRTGIRRVRRRQTPANADCAGCMATNRLGYLQCDSTKSA